MSNNVDGHRFANANEPSCKTCASFNENKDVCDSCDTTIYFTYAHQRCMYYKNKYKLLKEMKEMFKVL